MCGEKKLKMEDFQKHPRYPLIDAFNFLLVLIPHFGFFYPSYEIKFDHIWVKINDRPSNRELLVEFYADRINYYVEDIQHSITHGGTVDYIYFLLFKCRRDSWVKALKMKIWSKKMTSLAFTSLRRLSFNCLDFESTLRRYISNTFSYVQQYVCGHKSSKQTLLPLKRSLFSETLEKHDFNMLGDYSKRFNHLFMPYLLFLEAVVDQRHKWYRIDYFTHYCRVEEYHLFLRREKFWKNISMFIFLDTDVDKKTPSFPMMNTWVNDPMKLPNFASSFEYVMKSTILLEHFYNRKRMPHVILKLSVVAKLKIFFNFFIRKVVYAVSNQNPHVFITDNLEENNFWKQMLDELLSVLNALPQEMSALIKGEGKQTIYCTKGMKQINHSVKKAWNLARFVHTQHGFTLLKTSTDYRQMGLNMINKLDPYSHHIFLR